MSLEQIQTDDAYESSAPLSQAIRHGNTVYVSGNVPVDPETGELVKGGMGPQTRQVLENVEAVRRGGRRRIRYSPTAMVARERIINESDHENGQRPGSTRP
jgi:hypothetical protein